MSRDRSAAGHWSHHEYSHAFHRKPVPRRGYDGSAPAARALDAAVALLRGRTGSITVVYVAHLTAVEMMSVAVSLARHAPVPLVIVP